MHWLSSVVLLTLAMVATSHAVTLESSSIEKPALDELTTDSATLIRDSRLQEIIKLIRAGKQQAANARIAGILAQRPKDKDALELAGISLMMMKKFPAAEEAFRRLVELPPVKPEVITKYGVTKILNGDLERGAYLLRQVVQATPDDKLANRYLGWVAERTGQPQQAVLYLQKLPSVQAVGLRDYHIALARNYKQIGAYQAIIDMLSPVLSITDLKENAGNPQAALYLAQAYAAVGETAEAKNWVAALKPQIANDPLKLFQLEMGLAQVTGNIETAREAYRHLVESSFEAEPLGRFELARIYLARGNVIEAIAEYETVLTLVDEEKTADVLRAMMPVLLRENMRADAIRVMKQTTERYPANDEFAYALAELQATGGRVKDAHSTLTPLVERPQPHLPALLLAGKVARADRNYTLARRFLRQYLDSRPEDPNGWITLAGVHYDQHNLSRAMETLQAGIKANPNLAVLHYELGTLYQTNGQLELANRQYEAALAQDARYLAAMDNLASNLLDMNRDIERARELAATVYAELPDAPYIQDLWGWAQYRNGELEDAAAILRKAASSIADSGRADYHLALALRDLGQQVQADAHFRQALDKGLTPGLRSEVEAAINSASSQAVNR